MNEAEIQGTTEPAGTAPAAVDHFRARVEVERKRLGLTVAQVAERMGRSPSALTEVLRGGNPTLATLQDLAAALGIAPSDLVRPVTAEEYGAAMMPRCDKANGHNG
jgi:transcriptional regulator with XRE-family HTH domain